MAEARDEMLQAAGATEGSDLARALAIVSGKVNEQDFAELLGGLIRARGRIRRLDRARAGGLETLVKTLRARLGLAPADDAAGIRPPASPTSAFDRAALKRAAQALAQGSGKTDRAAGGGDRRLARCERDGARRSASMPMPPPS